MANSFAQRWTGTLRRQLLDRALIWNHQLERLIVDYIDHYNTHRLLRGSAPNAHHQPIQTVRSTRCSRPINEYQHAA